MAKIRRPQAPKVRNFTAKAVRDPKGPFRPRAIKNKIKSKEKYPIKVDLYEE